MSDVIYERFHQLNLILYVYRFDGGDEGCKKFGKEKYLEITQVLKDIEKSLTIDFAELHKVKKFLREKARKQQGFSLPDAEGNAMPTKIDSSGHVKKPMGKKPVRDQPGTN